MKSITFKIDKSKNSEMLLKFVDYCVKHPELRFWQCLRGWSDNPYIYISNIPIGDIDIPPEANSYLTDTFYL